GGGGGGGGGGQGGGGAGGGREPLTEEEADLLGRALERAVGGGLGSLEDRVRTGEGGHERAAGEGGDRAGHGPSPAAQRDAATSRVEPWPCSRRRRRSS